MAVTITSEFTTPGRGPAGLAWDGHHLWLSDYRDGRIYCLDEQAEVVTSLWCPGMLSGLTWDGQHLWQAVLDEGVVRSIDPATSDFDQTIDLKSSGLLSGVGWAGTHLYVVAQQTGDILSVDTASGKIVTRLPGPVAVGGLDYAAGSLWLSAATPMRYTIDGGFSWEGNSRDYALVQLDATDGRELTRHTLAGLYTGLAWAANDVLWLASAAVGKLYCARVTQD